jgi:hypothetical protein
VGSSYWGDEAVTRWVKTKVVAVVVAVAVAEQLFRRVADTHACSVFISRQGRPASSIRQSTAAG